MARRLDGVIAGGPYRHASRFIYDYQVICCSDDLRQISRDRGFMHMHLMLHDISQHELPIRRSLGAINDNLPFLNRFSLIVKSDREEERGAN